MINNFIEHISNKDEEYVIFDVGSRDCVQSIEFYRNFPNSKIYAFECNPNTLPICKNNIQKYSDRITLIEGAVCDYDGIIKFYPIDQEKTITSWKDGNPGASSIFKSNGSYEHEKYIQYEINTVCHRLDTIIKKYNIENVDIIWMDLQGAELLALKGLGDYINNVKFIHTEVSYKEMYSGQCMYDELNSFILSHNFTLKNKLSFNGWQEDAIYEKKMISLMNFEEQIYSQNGEDGITIELIKIIFKEDLYNKYYVEFGTQDGSQCNTRILLERFQWTGLLMDGSYSNDSINLKKEFITKDNILYLFNKYNVLNHINLLSIDIDFNDFYVLHQILKKYTCDIIILEYNAYFLPNEDAVIIYDADKMWDGSNYFSASLLAFKKLLNKFNYSLVYTETKGVNAFFVNDKYKNCFHKAIYNNIDFLYNTPKYGSGPRGSHSQDTLNRRYITSGDILDAFDIVISLGKNDCKNIEKHIKYTKKNIIGYRNIYIISYDPSLQIEGCITINENMFPFSIYDFPVLYNKYDRNKWYLQQLLKLYAGFVIPGILDRYLVIDADTFFLKPTTFFENGKCLYNYGNEYHIEYFEHMKLLHPSFTKVFKDKSGICHHMIFEKKYIKELFKLVENDDIFYNIFLKNINTSTESGASEYELYFNFIFKNHPEKVSLRKLNWINSKTFDENNDYDYISCHWYEQI